MFIFASQFETIQLQTKNYLSLRKHNSFKNKNKNWNEI